MQRHLYPNGLNKGYAVLLLRNIFQFILICTGKFLRTHFPDIEVPAELIRDIIDADTHASHKLENYDPYAGDLLEAVIVKSVLTSQNHFSLFSDG